MSLILALLLSLSAAPLNLTNACHAENSWSIGTVTFLTRVTTSTDAGNAQLRSALDLPLATTTPPVELVTDESVCNLAVTALNSFYTDGLTHSPVYVFRIGTTRYGVSDGSWVIHVFDTNFQYKHTIR